MSHQRCLMSSKMSDVLPKEIGGGEVDCACEDVSRIFVVSIVVQVAFVLIGFSSCRGCTSQDVPWVQCTEKVPVLTLPGGYPVPTF